MSLRSALDVDKGVYPPFYTIFKFALGRYIFFEFEGRHKSTKRSAILKVVLVLKRLLRRLFSGHFGEERLRSKDYVTSGSFRIIYGCF